MLLEGSMNMLRVGYRCSGGVTLVDLPVKLTLTLLLLVWYCVSDAMWIFGAIGSTLRVGGFYSPPSEIVGSLQPALELVG